MKISVVIPVLNEAASIAKTLDSLAAQNIDAEVELQAVVVDGGSTDETVAMVREFAAQERNVSVALVFSERGRATQMNFGAKHASGQVLLFLHADSVLSKNAIREMVITLQGAQEAFGYFFMKFDSAHPLAELYSSFTLLNSIFCHYGDGGIFVRRTFFEQLGGFPQQELMEDVEFLFRARAKSDPLLIKNAYVTTSSRRFEKNGFVGQQVLNGTLLLMYFLGIDTKTLKTFYR